MDKENEVDNETYFSQKPVKQLVTVNKNRISERQKVQKNDNLFRDKRSNKHHAQVVPDGDEDLFGDYDESDDQKEVESEMEDENPNNELENSGNSNCEVTPTISDTENRMKNVPNVAIKVQRKLTARKIKTARNVNKLQFGRLSNKKLDLDGNTQIKTPLGVWVECALCTKWRYLKNVSYPVEIIENWNCSMTPNNKCNAEPDDWTDEMEAKYVRNKFVRGSIVWAKFNSLPWWPGVVDNDPDEGRCFRTDENTIPTECHVVFWDHKIWRSWIPVKKMQPFGPNGGTRTNTRGKNYYFRRIEAAKKQAAEASQMGFKERIDKFGFAAYALKGTYFGKQSRKSSAEINTGNLPKRSRKLSPHVEKENLHKHVRKPLEKISKGRTGKVTLKTEKEEPVVSSNSPQSGKKSIKKEKKVEGKFEIYVKDEDKVEVSRKKLKFVPRFKNNGRKRVV